MPAAVTASSRCSHKVIFVGGGSLAEKELPRPSRLMTAVFPALSMAVGTVWLLRITG